jgi:hypothetical protein
MTVRDIVMAAAGQSTGKPVVIAINSTVPNISMYPWNSSTGFGTMYAAPTTTTSGASKGSLHSSGKALAISRLSTSTPKLRVYPINSVAGIGTPYTDPASNPYNATNGTADVQFNPSGTHLICLGTLTSAESMGLSYFPFDVSTGFGTRASSTVSKVGTPLKLDFNPAGDVVFAALSMTTYNTTNVLSAWPWNASTGFGAEYSNPTSIGGTTSTAYGVNVNKAGNAVAIAASRNPYLYVYPWNNSTGFGTKFSNPSTLPTGLCYAVKFNSNDSAIAVGMSNSPYVHVYAWNNGTGFGAKYADPTSGLSVRAEAIEFTQNDDAIIMSTYTTSPYITSYEWSNVTGFGSVIGSPPTAPSGRVSAIIYGEI